MTASDLNIKKGDYITVTEWTNTLMDTNQKDQSYVGDCLEVTATDKNLLRINMIRSGGKVLIKTTINLNKVMIRKLSQDFVDTIMNEKTTL